MTYSPFAWSAYGKHFKERIIHPRNAGYIASDDIKDMRVVHGEEKGRGFHLLLTLVVDTNDGIIADVKFQVIGESEVVGLLDLVCDLLVRKSYIQARRITLNLIEQTLGEALPARLDTVFNWILFAIEEATSRCMDIPLADPTFAAEPLPAGDGEPYPGFDALTVDEKIAVIQKVIDTEIQPYIALDAGGITLEKLEGLALTISYQGACTTCPSSTGSTLSSIQHILQQRVHPSLNVIPDLSFAGA